jgi:two-component system sensor histidine kinase UhpB
MTARGDGPGPRVLAALLLAYPPAWILLEELSTTLAFWPVALRFLLLWNLPVRQWPAVVLVDAGSAVVARSLFQGEPLLGVGPYLISLAPVLIYALMIRLARGADVPDEPDTPLGMSRLLGAATLCTFGVAPVLALYLGAISDVTDNNLDALLAFGFGDLFGLLVVVPAALALRGDAGALWRSRRWGFEAALAFTLTLGVMSLARQRPTLDDHLLLIVFLPTVLLAFRHGWRGAAWSMAVLGALLALGFSGHPDPLRLQVMAAVIGGAALLLGAATSQLREQRETVEAQHAALRLAMLDQRELAGRIVAMEDDGQRQVAESLHQQVAPPLQELRTLLAMAWRSQPDERDARMLESLRGHTWQVQDGLERALRRLQPPALARGDLQALLSHGPLWEWAQEQGVGWRVELEGPVQRLPERWRAVLYRIAQAGLEQGLALGARECRLRIVAIEGVGSVDLDLQLDLAWAGPPPPRLGIDAIRDRTLAAGGRYRCEPRPEGCRHTVHFADVVVVPG